MPNVEELLSYRELIDYTKEAPVKPRVLEELFPTRKTEALEVDMIKGANNLPVSAHIHAFDTETEIDTREGTKYDMAEMALVKRKRKLSEKELIQLEAPRNSAEEREAMRKIYNDVDALKESILTRIEVMRGEAITTGKLAIDENNYKTNIDYGVPQNHKGVFTWGSGTPDILGDLDIAINRIVDDTGFTPTRILTSKKKLNTMLKDESIRKAFLGTEKDRLLTPAELNTHLKAMSFPTIATYDAKYRTLDKKGKYTTVRYFPEDALIMMPDGRMGETLYGLTAEEIELRKRPGVDIESLGNIIIEMYATNDPVAKWIKAVATAMITFPYADQVFMATVN